MIDKNNILPLVSPEIKPQMPVDDDTEEVKPDFTEEVQKADGISLGEIDLDKYVKFDPVDIVSLKELIEIMDVRDVHHLVTLFDKISGHQTDLYKLELKAYIETTMAKKQAYLDIINAHKNSEKEKIDAQKEAHAELIRVKSATRREDLKKVTWYVIIMINVIGFIASLFTGQLVEFFVVLFKVMNALPK